MTHEEFDVEAKFSITNYPPYLETPRLKEYPIFPPKILFIVGTHKFEQF